jgi:hypothetical protein
MRVLIQPDPAPADRVATGKESVMHQDNREFILRMRARTDQRREEIDAFGDAAQMERLLARDRVIAAAASLVAAERTRSEDHAGEQAAKELDEAVLRYAAALSDES